MPFLLPTSFAAVAESRRPFIRCGTRSPASMSGQLSDVYASFSRRAFARFLDSGLILSVCGFLYLLNLLLGFPIKYSTLFDARQVTSLESFMYYNFPGVALTFIAIKLLVAYPYFAFMESSSR